MKHDVPWEWGCGHTLSHFGIRHFGNPKERELERLESEVPKSQKMTRLWNRAMVMRKVVTWTEVWLGLTIGETISVFQHFGF
jgi:hypothetical protein